MLVELLYSTTQQYLVLSYVAVRSDSSSKLIHILTYLCYTKTDAYSLIFLFETVNSNFSIQS